MAQVIETVLLLGVGALLVAAAGGIAIDTSNPSPGCPRTNSTHACALVPSVTKGTSERSADASGTRTLAFLANTVTTTPSTKRPAGPRR